MPALSATTGKAGFLSYIIRRYISIKIGHQRSKDYLPIAVAPFQSSMADYLDRRNISIRAEDIWGKQQNKYSPSNGNP